MSKQQALHVQMGPKTRDEDLTAYRESLRRTLELYGLCVSGTSEARVTIKQEGIHVAAKLEARNITASAVGPTEEAALLGLLEIATRDLQWIDGVPTRVLICQEVDR